MWTLKRKIQGLIKKAVDTLPLGYYDREEIYEILINWRLYVMLAGVALAIYGYYHFNL